MARTRNSVPTYLHAQSDRARAVWTDGVGIRHFRMLPGQYGSKESKAAYSRLVAELASSPATFISEPDNITVSELFVAFLEHAEKHYVRPDGRTADFRFGTLSANGSPPTPRARIEPSPRSWASTTRPWPVSAVRSNPRGTFPT